MVGEDRWIAIVCETDAQWRALCSVINRKDLASHPRLSTVAGRRENAAEIDAAISDWTSGMGPGAAEAHNNLGLALAQTPGGLPEAIAEYLAALQIDPDSAQAHLNLGKALAQTPGRQADAIAEYEAVLRIAQDPELRRAAERLRAGLR